jgi:hypothetical protein
LFGVHESCYLSIYLMIPRNNCWSYQNLLLIIWKLFFTPSNVNNHQRYWVGFYRINVILEKGGSSNKLITIIDFNHINLDIPLWRLLSDTGTTEIRQAQRNANILSLFSTSDSPRLRTVAMLILKCFSITFFFFLPLSH